MDIHSKEWKGPKQLAGKDLKRESTAPVIDLNNGYVTFTTSLPLICMSA
jgi:hypothetical protein